MEVIMLLKKDLKWSPDGIQIINIPAGEYEAGSLPERALGAAARMWSLDGTELLSLKSVISGVKANEALCK